MIFNEEFNQNSPADFPEEEPNYPVAFGMTFTPKVTGIALGLLGFAAAGYILLNFVLPVYDSYQTLKTEESTKQEKVDANNAGTISQQLAEAKDRLAQAEVLRSQVLSQFTSPQNLQTLLYDISQLAQARGVTLNSYKPEGELTTINDGSLGAPVNNKLKRQIFTLDIEGSYPKIYGFISDLEKLQPLLIVSGLKIIDKSVFELEPQNGAITSKLKFTPTPEETIKASFNLEAIVPLSREELAKLAQSAKKEKDQEKPASEEGKSPPAEK